MLRLGLVEGKPASVHLWTDGQLAGCFNAIHTSAFDQAADCMRKNLCGRRNIERSILLEDNGMLQPISRTSPNISDSAEGFFERWSHDVTPKDTFQRDISCFREI